MSDFPLQLVRPLGQCITWPQRPRGGENGVRDTVTFTASGSPQVVSRAIEEYARGQGRISAIVVPWESTETTLSRAVTAVKSAGWAIEHTNLGTIRLKEAGRGTTPGATPPNPA